MEALPWMGLGLSSNLGAHDRPQPWALLDAHPGLFDYVEYSAPLSIEAARREAPLFPTLLERRREVPAIFHPVHLNLWGPALESAENLRALREHLREVGSPWVGNDVAWWHHRDAPFPGYLFVPPPLSRAALPSCVEHALHVQEGAGAPLLLENPAAMARDGELHVLDFMAELHRHTRMGLILDLGHLFAHQLSHGLPIDAGLDGFPLEAVVELHVAGGVVTERGGRRFYADDHGQPVREELFALLEAILPRCPGLRAVTFEADGHPEPVARATLRRLRALVPSDASPSPAPPQARGAPAPLPDAAAPDPWASFRRAWAGEGGGADPVGERADTDFRLAVLAQELDRDWPLSRLLLAGTRERLLAFAASEELAAYFDGSGRTLASCFGRWARGRLRAGTEPSAEPALALEAWAQGLLGRGAPEAVGTFPADLGELLFAAASLRRHLSDRAWASGLLEPSGLSSLAQVAARAGPGPWRVAVRRERGRLRILPLP